MDTPNEIKFITIVGESDNPIYFYECSSELTQCDEVLLMTCSSLNFTFSTMALKNNLGIIPLSQYIKAGEIVQIISAKDNPQIQFEKTKSDSIKKTHTVVHYQGVIVDIPLFDSVTKEDILITACDMFQISQAEHKLISMKRNQYRLELISDNSNNDISVKKYKIFAFHGKAIISLEFYPNSDVKTALARLAETVGVKYNNCFIISVNDEATKMLLENKIIDNAQFQINIKKGTTPAIIVAFDNSSLIDKEKLTENDEMSIHCNKLQIESLSTGIPANEILKRICDTFSLNSKEYALYHRREKLTLKKIFPNTHLFLRQN